MLTPHGIQAARIAELFMTFLVITGAVYVIVMLVAAFAVKRGHGGASTPLVDTRGDTTALRLIAVGIGITVVTLVVLLVLAYRTGHAIAADNRATVAIKVSARQWWWRFQIL